MIVNVESNSVTNHNLNVTTLPYATVTIKKNDRVHTVVADDAGMAVFKNLSGGTWSATATSQDGNLTNTVAVDVRGDVSIEIVLNYVLDFTYSISAANGGYAVYDDTGNDITSNPVTQGNWKIKFYKTGVLTINKLNGAADGIDVFCVGGGGKGAMYNQYADPPTAAPGGGGGYTTTQRGVSVPVGKYDISIGGSGGTTYAFKGTAIEVSAKNGGNAIMYDGTTNTKGGDGGSGGGNIGCVGGSNGGDGGSTGHVWGNGGKGQGNPPGTREFHESTGMLYAGGGGGGSYQKIGASGGSGGGGQGGGGKNVGKNGTANTGGGGGGGGWAWGAGDNPGSGGSGIVVIRNKR